MQSRWDWLDALIASEQLDNIAIAESDISASIRRVAILTEAFLPKVDGVTRTVLLTIKYLEATGRKVIVLAPAPTIPQLGRARVYGIPALALPVNSETRVAVPWPFTIEIL